MGNNVIILGAGFSYDAGIPLLRGFVESMWHLAMTKRCHGVPLEAGDVKIFEAAITVGTEIESYHSRAKFDDRNIEDLLSILTFNALSNSKKSRQQLTAISKAITRTIELTCRVKHPGVSKTNPGDVHAGISHYREFWYALLTWYSASGEMPTIITFNYDLVLERSLLQLLIGKEFPQDTTGLKIRDLCLDYHHDNAPSDVWKIKDLGYHPSVGQLGFTLEKTDNPSPDFLKIDLLKLHGSVNFSRTKVTDKATYNMAEAIADPYILPPIFNKFSSSSPGRMWKAALERLSKAQNIIIVGYSLPKTDIYMQYFLKAAVGANTKLNRIYVFDPELAQPGARCEKMKKRYNACFADQLRSRIVYTQFIPLHSYDPEFAPDLGRMSHFVRVLRREPTAILYK